ncbi:unnamed protein product [Darwinula stevensoni]|uniref:Methyltransferase FkbM domain-containing protein n=1 Tax=Darwinula stevensoni TaxID=69355 RepID=A0A7R9AF69_9CRUS|nr:unnamed protein product [Darwinula stevensoni]CAG0902995.1 unnamed protein product [Darwinula stevensoni]
MARKMEEGWFHIQGAETETWDEQELLLRIVEKGENISANDPRLLKYIKNNVLIPPLPSDIPYNLTKPQIHFSQFPDQVVFLQSTFENSTGGFFIEAGAYDGETFSNTLWLERERKWTGLLVEPDARNFASLKAKMRKAWLSHSCLSPIPYPQQMSLEGGGSGGKMTSKNQKNKKGQHLICFPLESLLRAIGQSKIDFFSLDIEGLDYEVLTSIPWDILDIQIMMVESNKGTREKILKYMAVKNYRHAHNLTIDDIFDKPRT